MEMTKNNEKNAGAAATTTAAAAAGHVTFAWEKRLRRLVDDYTFEEYHHVDHVPRIEDHAHENVDVVVAVPDVFVSSKPSSTFSLCDSFKSKSTIATSSTTSSSRSSATATSSSILASPKTKAKASTTSTTTTTKRSGTVIPTGSTSRSDGSSHSTSGSTSTPKQSRRRIKLGSDHSSSHTKSRTDNVLSPRSTSKKKNLTESSDHSSSRRSKTSTTSSSTNSRKNVDGSSDHSSSPRKSSSSSSTSKKKLLSPSSSTPKTKKKLVKKISSSTTDSSSKVDSESNHSSASGASSPRTPRSKKTPKSSSSSPRKKVSSGGDLSSPTKRKPGTPSKATKNNTVVQGDLNIPSLFTAPFPPTSSSTTNSPRSAKTTPRVTNKKTISSSLSSSSSSSPLKKKSNGGLGAFLHQNAVEQFTDKILKSAAAASSSDDGMSVGSKSISSKSVSELSHAERSKAEDSIPRKSWWKSRRATTTSNLRNQMFAVRSDSARSLNESNDDMSISKSGRTNGMLSIDEMSTTDLSEAPPIPASPHGVASNKSHKSPVGRTSPSTSSRNSPKNNSPVSQGGDLGTFLQKSYFSKLQDDDDDDDDNEETELTMAMLNGSADDMQSVASASTFGHRSISELSTAEQSRSELRLRDRSKKRKDSTTESTKTVPTSSTVEKSEEKSDETSMLDKQKEPEEIQVQAPAPRVSHPPKSCLRPCKYGGGNSNAVNDTNNDSMKLDDLAADLSDNKLIKFKDGHSQKEIPDLTDSLYDILFYTEEQLADFRYEAFLEECGLDVDEFM